MHWSIFLLVNLLIRRNFVERKSTGVFVPCPITNGFGNSTECISGMQWEKFTIKPAKKSMQKNGANKSLTGPEKIQTTKIINMPGVLLRLESGDTVGQHFSASS